MRQIGSPGMVLAAVRRMALHSVVAGQLLGIVSDPRHDRTRVVQVVSCDAALTAQVLRAANSAAFVRRTPVTTLARATAMLGESTVVGIALGIACSRIFQHSLAGYHAERGDLWRHDLLAALAAKRLTHFSGGQVNEDLAFTAGLLHDIGKAVLSDFLVETKPELLERLAVGRSPDFCAAEAETLGIDHPAVGRELALFWQLPEPLPTVIGSHHRPAGAPEAVRPLVYTVHLADHLAMMAGCCTGADGMQYPLDPGYPDHLHIAAPELSLLFLEIQEEYSRILASLGCEEGGPP